MREIGQIKAEKLGQRFLNFLHTQNIEGELRDGDGEGFSIWILDDDQLEQAREALLEFLKQPQDSRFDADPSLSSAQKTTSRARYIDVQKQIFSRSVSSQMPMMMGLIVLSVLTTFLIQFMALGEVMSYLSFSEYYGRSFPEIASGQLWRIVTPIFIHGGLLHLGFNMLWLYQLGGMIEGEEGSRYFLLMVLIFAGLCNTAQYLVSGPLFGGMSGVVYGLLGYIWMMSRYSARQYAIQPQTVVFMLIWMLICLVGIIPNVANTQHVVGFGCGTAFGFFRSGGLKTWRRRREFKRRL